MHEVVDKPYKTNRDANGVAFVEIVKKHIWYWRYRNQLLNQMHRYCNSISFSCLSDGCLKIFKPDGLELNDGRSGVHLNHYIQQYYSIIFTTQANIDEGIP